MQRPEGFMRVAHHRLDGLLVQRIEAHPERAAARGLDLAGDHLRRLDVHVGHHDARAFARHQHGARAPDAGGRAGDDGDLVLQASHACLLVAVRPS